jgi:alpha/beta superfamily hydrolase
VGVWDFSGAEDVEGRKMILAGDGDSFCPMPSLRDFYEGLSDPKELVVLPGADHFFWGHEGTLSEEIAKGLRKWEIT